MKGQITLENVEVSDIHDRPELITSLLYKKLLQKLDEAVELLSQSRYVEANRAMQLCNDIITRLGFGLKYEAGVVADQLESLYHYMFEKIYEANLKKDKKPLIEIRNMVEEIDRTWDQAMEQSNSKGTGEGANTGQIKSSSPNTFARPSALNPYQKREIEREVYEYEQGKQEIHLKK